MIVSRPKLIFGNRLLCRLVLLVLHLGLTVIDDIETHIAIFSRLNHNDQIGFTKSAARYCALFCHSNVHSPPVGID